VKGDERADFSYVRVRGGRGLFGDGGVSGVITTCMECRYTCEVFILVPLTISGRQN
jgi:hypothetical protein